ncbi:hypothetical protein [Ekhidna sp.]|uniref:hypothetical protein n=1 Tax=Ekhidna sp. TaxID=2608089 RepID=UPI003297AD6C
MKIKILLLFLIALSSCTSKALVVGRNVVYYKNELYYQQLDSTNYMYQKIKFNPMQQSDYDSYVKSFQNKGS